MSSLPALDVQKQSPVSTARPVVTGDFADLALPTITTADGSFSYTLTPHDLLTLARSARKEGKRDVAQVAWTYAQRYVRLHRTFDTFADMVKAHSQPINPKWFPDGEYCRPGGRYAGTSYCESAASRPGNASIAWSDIEPQVRQDVAAWAAGRTPNPVPRATDFRAQDAVAARILASSTADFRLVQMGVPGVHNIYFSEGYSRAWPSGDYVRLVVDGRTVGVDPTWLWPMDLIGPLVATAGVLAAGTLYVFGRR